MEVVPQGATGNGGQFCPMCPLLKPPHVVQHVNTTHLPWYFSPATACWTCRKQFGSPSTLEKHLSGCPHGAFIHDGQLQEWVSLMLGLAHTLSTALGGKGPADLIGKMAALRPEVLNELALSPNLTKMVGIGHSIIHPDASEPFELLPPSSELAIAHWRIALELIMKIPSTSWERIRHTELCTDLKGCPVLSPENALTGKQIEFIDCNFRSQELFSISSCSNLKQYESKHPERLDVRPDTVLKFFIQASNTPEFWPTEADVNASVPQYHSIGVHPLRASLFTKECKEQLPKLLDLVNVLCINDCGLSYDNGPSYLKVVQQADVCRTLLQTAAEKSMPLVVTASGKHKGCDASKDLMTLIRQSKLSKAHKICWRSPSTTLSAAREFLDEYPNCVIEVSCNLLQPDRPADLPKIIKSVPLERIVLASGGPFTHLPTMPARSGNPTHVPAVAEVVAKLKKTITRVVLAETTATAEKFFLGR